MAEVPREARIRRLAAESDRCHGCLSSRSSRPRGLSGYQWRRISVALKRREEEEEEEEEEEDEV